MGARSDRAKPAVTIVGVGLIGGSLGITLRDERLARSVTGVFRKPRNIAKARRMGAVTQATTDPASGVSRADIVFLCAPPQAIVGLARRVMPHLKSGAILTDVGSTKADLVRRIAKFKRRDVSFIGGHPLAGSEKGGVEAAVSGLFSGSTWILTPLKNTRGSDLARLKRLLGRLCGRVRVMTPRAHDEILAFTSHLPHAVAVSLVNLLRPGCLPFVAKGYRDMTRIAAGNPRLWSEIFLTNSRAVAGSLKQVRNELARLERAVRNRNRTALMGILNRSKEKRCKLT